MAGLAQLHALRHPVVREDFVLLVRRHQALGHHLQEQPRDRRVVRGSLHVSAGLCEEEYGLDPRVPVRLLEAAERLAQREVTDDVEGGEVVPRRHVERLRTPGAVLVQPAEQQVDVGLYDGLLLAHRPVAEAVGQLAADDAVLLPVGRDDVVGGFGHGPVEGHPLAALLALGVVAQDLLPGRGVRERELVGRDAHHGAVLLVHVQHVDGECAAQDPDVVGDPGGSP